ncbi:MAG: glycosyltransferase [Roseibacillus sp.]
MPTSCDEEETLQSFYDGIREQAEQVAADWELLFVGHGVKEETHRWIARLTEKDPSHVRPFRIRSGARSDALALGYRQARGEVVLTLESDQDNDLKEIAPFLNRISQDRTSSGDRWQKILPRGILRRIAPSRMSKSTQAPRAMLPA